MGVATLGWIAHVIALGLAPLSLVQAVIAGGLVFLAVLAERFFGVRMGARQWAGVALTAAGLALLAITLPGAVGHHQHPSHLGLILFEGVLLAAGGALSLSAREGRAPRWGGPLLGAASGIMFGVCDVSIKALTMLSPSVMVTSPWLLFALVPAVIAFYTSARSYQLGDAVSVITITALAASFTGILGGFVVFGEPLPREVWQRLGHVSAFVLVLGAVVLVPAPRGGGRTWLPRECAEIQ